MEGWVGAGWRGGWVGGISGYTSPPRFEHSPPLGFEQGPFSLLLSLWAPTVLVAAVCLYLPSLPLPSPVWLPLIVSVSANNPLTHFFSYLSIGPGDRMAPIRLYD